MPSAPNPPLDHFLAQLGEGRAWAEVWIVRSGDGFGLCHLADRETESSELRLVPVADLRDLAARTEGGRFRPLSTAPTLRRGWRCIAVHATELGHALHRLYPSSLVDAWAFEVRGDRGADWAAIVARLPGRMAGVGRLTDRGLAEAIDAGCDSAVCLKRREWKASGVPGDDGRGKSSIPCLEPCPVFLGFARACAEGESTATVAADFAPDDLATLAAALRHALDAPPPELREGDFAAPLNPRRIVRLLARRREVWSQAVATEPESEAHD